MPMISSHARARVLFGAALLLTACSPKDESTDPARDAGAGNAPHSGSKRAAPLPEALLSATYYKIYDEPVALRDGRWSGAPFEPGGASRPRVSLIAEPFATGDLDGDGVAEIAVLLTENSGGSGTFVYLALMRATAGNVVNADTILLGDRVKVQTLQVQNARIRIDMLTSAPGDPACCPTSPTQMAWQLRDGKLIAASAEDAE